MRCPTPWCDKLPGQAIPGAVCSDALLCLIRLYALQNSFRPLITPKPTQCRSMSGALSMQSHIRGLEAALSERDLQLSQLSGAVSAKALKGEVMQQARPWGCVFSCISAGIAVVVLAVCPRRTVASSAGQAAPRRSKGEVVQQVKPQLFFLQLMLELLLWRVLALSQLAQMRRLLAKSLIYCTRTDAHQPTAFNPAQALSQSLSGAIAMHSQLTEMQRELAAARFEAGRKTEECYEASQKAAAAEAEAEALRAKLVRPCGSGTPSVVSFSIVAFCACT